MGVVMLVPRWMIHAVLETLQSPIARQTAMTVDTRLSNHNDNQAGPASRVSKQGSEPLTTISQVEALQRD